MFSLHPQTRLGGASLSLDEYIGAGDGRKQKETTKRATHNETRRHAEGDTESGYDEEQRETPSRTGGGGGMSATFPCPPDSTTSRRPGENWRGGRNAGYLPLSPGLNHFEVSRRLTTTLHLKLTSSSSSQVSMPGISPGTRTGEQQPRQPGTFEAPSSHGQRRQRPRQIPTTPPPWPRIWMAELAGEPGRPTRGRDEACRWMGNEYSRIKQARVGPGSCEVDVAGA